MSSKQIRILAAIMFTDMVGYTALMQENEQLARKLRNRQKDVLNDKIIDHTGRILQYYGDGTLSIFGSVIQAVKCAVEIQKELNKDPKVPMRIGIHLGDVLYDDEGVFGDGVNIASRIENLAIPGCVFISDRVYDEIKNQDDLSAVSVGLFELKNVKKPVEIFSVTANGLPVPQIDQLSSRTINSRRSIAVLPFVNMSADTENEYFSDGITEEIINALTKVDTLRVTSRTSSFSFKNKHEDIRKIGAQLGVSTVLEGSVRKAGERVRITAQLINVVDGYHEWSEVYDRKITDIFELQDEISNTIASRLQHREKNRKHEKLVNTYTENLEAYNLFLKGQFHWNKWTPSDIKKALKFYGQAIEIEKDFALPYCGIANCYTYLGAMGQQSPKTAFPKAKEAAETALRLDPERVEPHISIALVHLFYDWDLAVAGNIFQKMVNHYEGYADVHYTYALYLMACGRRDEALTEMETAIILDPLSLQINNYLGQAYSLTGRYDDAIAQLKKTLEMDRSFRTALYTLGFTHLLKNDFQAGIDCFLEAQRQVGGELYALAPLGYAYALAGLNDKAHDCIAKLEKRKSIEKDATLGLDFALIYAGLKDRELTLKYLYDAYEDKIGGIVFIKVQHAFSFLEDDPKFKELLKKIGLN